MDPVTFFQEPETVAQKQYEALRMYYLEGAPAQEVAYRFGYTYRAATSLVSAFRARLNADPSGSFFFVESAPGRKVSPETTGAKAVIIEMRKKYYSVPDIKVALDGLGHSLSEKNIYNIIHAEGFATFAGPVVFQMTIIAPIGNGCKIEVSGVFQQSELQPYLVQLLQERKVHARGHPVGIRGVPVCFRQHIQPGKQAHSPVHAPGIVGGIPAAVGQF